MPKQLEIASATNITERWTITHWSVAPPTLPGTVDGSIGITFLKETLVGGVVKAREQGGDGASAAAFHAMWDDAGTRAAAALAAGATAKDALYVGLRDAMYAHMQRLGGPIPSAAV